MSLELNRPFARSHPSASIDNPTAPAPLPNVCFILHPWVVGGHQPCSYLGLREAEMKWGLRSILRSLPTQTTLWFYDSMDLEEPEGDVSKAGSAIWGCILQWKGRTFSTQSRRRGDGNVILSVSDPACQREADVLGRHLHIIKPSGFWLIKLAVANFQPAPCSQRRRKACQQGKWMEESMGYRIIES